MVPAEGSVRLLRDQHLGGSVLSLSGNVPHSALGSGVLFVELPWQGGAFAALNVDGPCGSFRQRFEVLLRSDDQRMVTVRSFQRGVMVGEWQVALQR